MFIGHFAVGFAGKKLAPRTSLGTLFLASQFSDLLWPILILLGIERVVIEPGNTAFTPLSFVHYPITHSLLAVIGWGCLVGGGYWLARRYRRGAIVLGLWVVSHWLLDFLTHRPDLPLVPGMPDRAGLGLWNYPLATLIAEGGLFVIGLLVYTGMTRPKDRVGSWGLWVLAGFLIATYAGNIFSPPPPSVEAIGYVGLAQWLLIPWGYWIDRHRKIG